MMMKSTSSGSLIKFKHSLSFKVSLPVVSYIFVVCTANWAKQHTQYDMTEQKS
jgi:hypothetical protein